MQETKKMQVPGHGNPLQNSCLGNPMDRGAWWVIVHRVAKSCIWLKWLSTHTLNIIFFCHISFYSSVQFSSSIVSDSLWPHGLQHARPPCPSPTPVSLLKLMSIESVMPSNHLILCHLPLLVPSVFPSIRVFSNESTLCMRWTEYWSFSFSIIPLPYIVINQPWVYMCPPPWSPLPFPSPQACPSAPALSALFHALNLD